MVKTGVRNIFQAYVAIEKYNFTLLNTLLVL